jgi:hypothetical protein
MTCRVWVTSTHSADPDGMIIFFILKLVLYIFMIIRVDALTSSTQKLKLMKEDRQFTYTLQHPYSRAAREKDANVKINGFELETCDFDAMLELTY